MNNATDQLELPPVDSKEFIGLVVASIIAPYLFCLLIYRYHFVGRQTHTAVRGEDDKPLLNAQDWQSAIFKPEGITAPVAYMITCLLISQTTSVDLVPASVKTLSVVPRPWVVFAQFLCFDLLMWHIHYVQHRWRWLYYNTHAVHHTIASPTMIVALTGYLPDTCLLILLPLHLTIALVPANLADVFVFTSLSLLHLHAIHSEFFHKWDPALRSLHLVDTTFHHGHHLKPRSNLAHFFVDIDRFYGTFFDAADHIKLKHHAH